MPVVSSGQTVHQPHETLRRLGSSDLIYAAGGGIMGHPSGPAEGVQSLREAWDAAISDTPREIHAQTHPALTRALAAQP
jgi:ribulose-bisphosphate carboxylase large chain